MTTTLAWWVAAELVRRHPGELHVIETHPGGGQYDCVSIYRSSGRSGAEVVVHMNVTGTLTHGTWFRDGGERFNWLEVLLSANRRSYIVEQIERVEGLTSPPKTPSTDTSTVGPMLVAAFLERSVLGPARWCAVNGVADSSEGVHVRTECFEQFPDAERWCASVEGDFGGRREYRFWFVGEAGHAGAFSLERPAFAVDTWTGHLWRRDPGDRVDLLGEHMASARSLDALVSSVCPPAF